MSSMAASRFKAVQINNFLDFAGNFFAPPRDPSFRHRYNLLIFIPLLYYYSLSFKLSPIRRRSFTHLRDSIIFINQ
jgi:hypothetical protein